jgi:hypothetical protein
MDPIRSLRAVLTRTFGCVRPARVFREGAENGARGGRGPLKARSWEFGEKHSKDDDDDENEDDSLARHILPRKLQIDNELQMLRT